MFSAKFFFPQQYIIDLFMDLYQYNIEEDLQCLS